MLRRWVATYLNPPFQRRRHLPVMWTALSALLALAAFSVWWTRRLAREAQERRRSDQQLEDIGRTLQGVAFRMVLDENMQIKRSFFSHGVNSFLSIHPSVDGKTIDVQNKPLRGGQIRSGQIGSDENDVLAAV